MKEERKGFWKAIIKELLALVGVLAIFGFLIFIVLTADVESSSSIRRLNDDLRMDDTIYYNESNDYVGLDDSASIKSWDDLELELSETVSNKSYDDVAVDLPELNRTQKYGTVILDELSSTQEHIYSQSKPSSTQSYDNEAILHPILLCLALVFLIIVYFIICNSKKRKLQNLDNMIVLLDKASELEKKGVPLPSLIIKKLGKLYKDKNYFNKQNLINLSELEPPKENITKLKLKNFFTAKEYLKAKQYIGKEVYFSDSKTLSSFSQKLTAGYCYKGKLNDVIKCSLKPFVITGESGIKDCYEFFYVNED